MKRVSFKVAKALKEAGYPQDKSNSNNQYYYTKGGQLSDLYHYGVPYYDVDCFAPTYLEVWLWLWREKKIAIDVKEYEGEWNSVFVCAYSYVSAPKTNPEEAIIAAIDAALEYLSKNK